MTIKYEIQEQPETVYLCQEESGPDSETVSGLGLRIQTRNSDYIQNLTDTFLSKDTSLVKIS